MILYFMKCIYCEHPYVYILSNQQRKCSKCKRKFSLAKIKREKEILNLFTQGINASSASKQTGMHFLTIQKYYAKFRRNVARYSDEIYQQNAHKITGYDEYLYLPKSLKAEKNSNKFQHFLTMSYDDKVYNIMMPKAKRSLLFYEGVQDDKLLLKYLTFNKIAKLSKAQNTITKFWDYFEKFILQYKGVSAEEFVFYLKEAEWRFNTKAISLR